MMQQADHSVGMIRELPPFAGEDSTVRQPGAVRVACLEAFLMHVRAICDFLCCRPDALVRASDFSARDFVPDWQPTPPDAAKRLAATWVIASREIAHFSRDRLQANPAEPELHDTTIVALETMAADVQAVWDAFLGQAARSRGTQTG